MNETQNAVKTVNVGLGDRSYDILIGRDLIADIENHMPYDLDGRSVFILTDENVQEQHAHKLMNALETGAAASVQLLSLPAGEKTKSWPFVQQATEWLLENGVNRQSVLFAVGGGVIGDLAGFVASITLRGIDFVQVPTTLLAQVDSSVGGKTGIDTAQGKNLVGAFYQPVLVLCDFDVLESLPDREFRAGYAEVVKYGLLGDQEFYAWLDNHKEALFRKEEEALAHAIAASCQKKADIVKADAKEGGVRALLNLGHTFGHALELSAGFDGGLLHGEAVAIGTVLAFRLSARMGCCDDSDVASVVKHLDAVGLPTSIKQVADHLHHTPQEIVDFMRKDKKVYKGQLTFVLVRGIGAAYTERDVDIDDVIAVVTESY